MALIDVLFPLHFGSHLTWDPNPAVFHFNLPLLGRPLLWYGCLFAVGFFIGYLVLLWTLRRSLLLGVRTFSEMIAKLPVDKQGVRGGVGRFAESLTFYVMVGAIVGARLGDVLFYQDWHALWHRPLSVIAVWEGGLSSHGGIAGILTALFLFARRYKYAFIQVVDCVVLPAVIAAVFIRMGNFFNQEILGTPTDVPWGVLFLHPVDGAPLVPRHPVQLYEAVLYFLLFILLGSCAYRKQFQDKPGLLTGLFLLLAFLGRFLLEFFKVEQSVYLQQQGGLTMGQWLSIPVMMWGCFLLYRSYFSRASRKVA